jgi:hypothetical protein
MTATDAAGTDATGTDTATEGSTESVTDAAIATAGASSGADGTASAASTASTAELDTDDQLDMLRLMIRIRRFEERLALLFKRGKLPGFVHLYLGEEAVAVGVCSALRDDDRITSTHRGHGHLIAKGASIDRMMAELLGRVDGYCRGKGGSMHIVDFSLGIIGTNGIVGGGIPIGTGAAWGDKQLGRDNVTGHVLRRRRQQPGRLLRGDEPGGDLEAAGHLRLREQPVHRVDRDLEAHRRAHRRPRPCHGHSGRAGGRQRRPRRPGRDRGGRTPRSCR